MLHHVKEIQLRLLATVVILLAGMAIGYVFYEQLFQFIKEPLNAPLHYTSPAGSFSFIVKVCLMIGVIVALPVAVYNTIMFVQPALKERLSLLRVYVTTFMSLLLAGAGASFAFFVILPMALNFFHHFQVDGLEALISADDYLQFVVNVVITFALIFQLPLLLSIVDHITPIPPKKLFKAEKFIIVGSVAIGVLVPFALDPTIQLLIASPIILLYNIAIGVVMLQHAFNKRKARRIAGRQPAVGVQNPTRATTAVMSSGSMRSASSAASVNPYSASLKRPRTLEGVTRAPSARSPHRASSVRARTTPRLISDVRPRAAASAQRRPQYSAE
jgi:sec-independent protein translocase protein TatC